MVRPLEPKARLGWVLGGEWRFEPHSGPARSGAEHLAAALREQDRIDLVGEACVMVAVLLGEAVDADPTNAALWAQFRAALTELRGVGASDDDGDAFAQLLAELSAAVPNAPVEEPGDARPAGRPGRQGARPAADAAPAARRGRRGRTPS